MLQRLLLLVMQFGSATNALAEPSKLSGEIEGSIGSFLVRYESDHTMTGQAAVFIPRLGADRGAMVGRHRPALASVGTDGWMGNNTASGCNALAPPFIWLRDDGLSGTATIHAPKSRLPVKIQLEPDSMGNS